MFPSFETMQPGPAYFVKLLNYYLTSLAMSTSSGRGCLVDINNHNIVAE